MITYRIEVTDRLSNYNWIRRHTIQAKSDLAAVRKAKAVEGWRGVRCKREDYNDQIVLRPRGACIVIVIYCVGE